MHAPKEFRPLGGKTPLERIDPAKSFDAEAFWARLDALGARDFLPEGVPDEPLPPPDDVSFD